LTTNEKNRGGLVHIYQVVKNMTCLHQGITAIYNTDVAIKDLMIREHPVAIK